MPGISTPPMSTTDSPYLQHFGLRQAPFSIAPDPAFLYLSDAHREALAHLLWALRHDGGFVVLTGEVGTGKTTLSRSLLEQIPADTDIAYLINPRLDPSGLLTALRKELGDLQPGPFSDREQVDRIHESLLRSHATGRRSLLLIDEAQNLSAEVLEQLRLLTNLETSERKLLQVILLGQPELDRTLRRQELRQLDQRVTARYHLGPLPRPALQACIEHRLRVAGCNQTLFTRSALRALHRASGGIPRLANLIADRALLGAYAQDRQRVRAALVRQAAREIRGQHRAGPRLLQPALISLGVVCIGLLAGLLLSPPGPSLSSSITGSPATSSESAEATVTPPAGLQPVELPPLLPRPAPQPSWATRDPVTAFQSVLDSWFIPLTLSADEDPCEQVTQVGLACIRMELNSSDLARYDLPAVLHLSGAQDLHASLVGWHEDTMLLGSPAAPEQVSASTLHDHWQGAGTLLWQLPPGYREPLRTGNSGPSVQALEEALQVTGDLDTEPTDGFDAGTAAAVRRFQERQGIQVDGVAGPQTWILLLQETGTGIPSLRDGGAR